MSDDAKCRSCGAPILFVKTEKGNLIPLDAEPYVPPGLFVIARDIAVSLEHATGPAGPVLYRSHFATCPNAKKHRKPRS